MFAWWYISMDCTLHNESAQVWPLRWLTIRCSSEFNTAITQVADGSERVGPFTSALRRRLILETMRSRVSWTLYLRVNHHSKLISNFVVDSPIYHSFKNTWFILWHQVIAPLTKTAKGNRHILATCYRLFYEITNRCRYMQSILFHC